MKKKLLHLQKKRKLPRFYNLLWFNLISIFMLACGDIEDDEPPQLNHAPVAFNNELEVTQPNNLSIELVASDEDGDALTIFVVGQPEHGTLNGQGISFSYTPDSSYTGSDSFSFRANDGQVDSNLATISIDILASNNVASQSDNKGYSIFGPELLDIHLQAIDPNNDKLTYSIVEHP